ncbi:MAG: choice-of-anchor D domain-containing protein [Terracidiphilus sp.]
MVTFVHTASLLKARIKHLFLGRIGLLTIISSGLVLSGCAGSIATKSTGTSASTGTLVASSNSVAFGAVAVGQTAKLSVTLTNESSAPINVTQLNVSGQSFSANGQTGLPATISANGSFTLTIQFNPTSTGSATGQLTVTSDSTAATSTSLGLSGTGVPVLTGLSCSNGSIIGAGTDTCSITLNATADTGGLPVSLGSSNVAVAVPASVIVPAGSTSTSFTASVSPVTSLQAATLTASAGGVAQTFALQLGASVPALGISASNLAFGTVGVNSTITQSLTLTSTGNSAVTVSAAALTGTGFTISGGSVPVTLVPGQTTTLSVQFDPVAAGAVSGQLTLISDSSTGSSTLVTLSGTGVPVLSSLNCTNSSMAQAGTDRCIVTLNAAASGGFSVSLASSNSLVTVPAAVTVAAGATSASFSASVSPVSSSQSATLTASAGGISQPFTLQLLPGGPILNLSSTNVNFGDVAVGAPATQMLVLSSTGTTAVTINSTSLSGTSFAASGTAFPLTLNPNQTATLTLQFNPAATGSATGQFTLNSNSADGNSKKVTLAGRGVPVLTTLSCVNGSMTGAGTDSCTITLNSGAPSGGQAVTLASNNTAVTVPATVTVPPGSISASFTAKASAVNVAQAVTLSASTGGITKTFGLQLGASTITLGVSTASLAFGNVNVNTAATQTITLTSTGASAVTVSAATVAGSGFTVSGVSFPLTLNPNQTAALTVQFNPTAAGLATGQLTLTSNSSTGTSTLITLSGTGITVLSGLSCSSGSMTGAGADNCTVTLNSAAPAGGFTVNLASNNSAVAVPVTVTVPATASGASFTATVSAFSSAQTVTLTASAGGVAKTFALQLGAGVPTLSINATSLTFGSVSLNTPATQSVTLSSTGTATVTVSAATVIGGGFTLSGASLPLSLNPNQTATVSVQFDPTVAGAATGTLTIVSTSLTNPTSVISLNGTGVTGSSGTPGEVNLTWDAPSSSPDPVAGYNVYRSPTNAYSFVQLNSSMVAQSTYVDGTAQSGQTYDYIVESVDSSGVTSAPTNIATVAIP